VVAFRPRWKADMTTTDRRSDGERYGQNLKGELVGAGLGV
jgi:hypothetical protein